METNERSRKQRLALRKVGQPLFPLIHFSVVARTVDFGCTGARKPREKRRRLAPYRSEGTCHRQRINAETSSLSPIPRTQDFRWHMLNPCPHTYHAGTESTDEMTSSCTCLGKYPLLTHAQPYSILLRVLSHKIR